MSRARRWSRATLAGLPLLAAAVPGEERADRWRADVAAIASDANAGRWPGSPGHLRAAGFVEQRFRALALQPAGDGGGFRQQVPLVEQTVDQSASRARLVARDSGGAALRLGTEMIVAAGGGPRPKRVDAPLVFIGYGLHLPERGHDDLAGMDLRGRIAVVIGGGPADIPAAVKADARKRRAALLGRAGAVGMILLTPPRQIEIPWDRQVLLAQQSQLYLAEPALREMPDGFLVASFDPAASERLFAGTGHSFAALAAASDASARIPTFELPIRLQATLAVRRRALASPNLVARLPGADPALRGEHVILSGHLDHVGVGPAIGGDTIYNGAMDDGSGVATLLDLADVLSHGPRPRRSILFVVTTAEEAGLLGATWFARHPTVPPATLAADLNFDVILPLWRLTSILALGDGESSLGRSAAAAAARHGLSLVPDPLPDRNSFARTDQFSFVRAGVPALALKFGFAPGSAAFGIEHQWRATRYHAPSDDTDQPGVMPAEAIRFDDYAAALAREIADAPARPTWNPDSVFAPARATPRSARSARGRRHTPAAHG